MKGYEKDKRFKRRYLYIHQENSKQLDIEAAKDGTDISQALNKVLALYFSNQKEK